MKKSINLSVFFAVILFLTASLSAWAIDGKWKGSLNIQGVSLPLVLNISNTGESVVATLDSPQQNVYGLPVKMDYIASDSIAWSCARIGASFQGRITERKISGIFQQSGFKFPMTMEPEEPLSVRRPQTPQPPFPYKETDTTFLSGDGTLLAGTLTLPGNVKGKKYPIVVMVTGSGAQNRDEELFEHKPFAVIADYLARAGVASLRYDDRGTAKSQGSFREATTDIFRDDAEAALRFARGVKNVNKAGILGHSEGGAIAFMLASDSKPDFIVSLAGMVISGKETLLDQNNRALHKSGLKPQEVEQTLKLISAVFDETIARTDNDKVPSIDVDSIAKSAGVEVPAAMMRQIKAAVANYNPYFVKLLKLDVSKGLEKVKCPVLAINGDLDTQVDASKNLSAIRKGVPHAQIYEMPGLNHLMQHAKTGDVAEYANIRETISPDVLKMIADFVRSL